MINLIESKTGKRKLYAKYAGIFDSHDFSIGMYQEFARVIERQLLKYEQDNYKGDPVAHSNMVKRERKIFLRSTFSVFGSKVKSVKKRDELNGAMEEFLTEITKRKDVSLHLEEVRKELQWMCLGNLKTLTFLVQKWQEGQYPYFFDGIEKFRESLIERVSEYNQSVLPKVKEIFASVNL